MKTYFYCPVSSRKKYQTRAAAMAETVIVMPVMAILFSALLYWTSAYDTKLDQVQRTRRDIFYFTSNECSDKFKSPGITENVSFAKNMDYLETRQGMNDVNPTLSKLNKKGDVSPVAESEDEQSIDNHNGWTSKNIRSKSATLCNTTSKKGTFFEIPSNITKTVTETIEAFDLF